MNETNQQKEDSIENFIEVFPLFIVRCSECGSEITSEEVTTFEVIERNAHHSYKDFLEYVENSGWVTVDDEEGGLLCDDCIEESDSQEEEEEDSSEICSPDWTGGL